MESQNEELKKKIESILFASGKKIEISEIAKLCRMSHNLELVEKLLKDLQKKYDEDESSLMLVQEATAWKLTVREKYVSVVQKIVTSSELSKSITETLAVIAYKSPVLQSDIIKIRTNKAYDHLKELENAGYITREKKGRTKLIKLSPKFFEYFDVPPEKLKEKFRTVEELEKAVELKEEEAAEAKSEAMEKKEHTKKKEDEFKEMSEKEAEELDKAIKQKEKDVPEVDLLDDKGRMKRLETYDSPKAEGTEFEEPKSNIEVIKNKVGELDVVELGLTAAEKKELVKESELMKKQDIAEAAGKKAVLTEKEAAEAEKTAAEEKEKAFEKKFDILGGEKEEKPEEKEEKEEPEEEAPEEKEGAEPEEGEKPEEAEEEQPAIKKEDILKPKKEEPSERITRGKLAKEAAELREKGEVKSKEGKRLYEKGMSKEMTEKVDKRVEEIVFGKKEEEPPEEKEEKEGETPERY